MTGLRLLEVHQFVSKVVFNRLMHHRNLLLVMASHCLMGINMMMIVVVFIVVFIFMMFVMMIFEVMIVIGIIIRVSTLVSVMVIRCSLVL